MDSDARMQARVAEFVEANGLDAPAAYRLLDAVSELGEVAKAVCTSTGYGSKPGDLAVPEDELGDALFAMLALCEGLDVDAESVLETALEKYESRLEERGTAGSGVGSDSETDSNSGLDTGSNSGLDTGSNSGSDTGPESGSGTGSATGSNGVDD